MKDTIVKFPRTKPTPILLVSGVLTTGPNEITILLPIKVGKALEHAELHTWKEKGVICSKTKLTTGLILIFPGTRYTLPDDVPFIPLFCRIAPLDTTEQARERQE